MGKGVNRNNRNNKRNARCPDVSAAITAQKPMVTTTEVFDTQPSKEEIYAEYVETQFSNSNTTTGVKTMPNKTAKAQASVSTKTGTAPTWATMSFWKSESWRAIQKRMQSDESIVPKRTVLFRPFIETPLSRVKVVILGVEPSAFANPATLDGLAYSCAGEYKALRELPATTRNILIEAQSDADIGDPKTGSLRFWARQGVLLWNAIPTVQRGFALSCNKWGWEELTMEVLETAFLANPNTVFVFWNSKTHIYRDNLPQAAMTVTMPGPGIETAHQFLSSRPFSRINELLDDTGQSKVDWSVR